MRTIFILVALGVVTSSSFAQINNTNLYEFFGTDNRNTVTIQDFDEEEGGTKELTWTAEGSRYITKTDEKPYPQIGFINSYPDTLSKEFFKEDPSTMRILAVRGAFNQRGYNSLSLIPHETEENSREKDKNGDPLPGAYFDSPILRIGAYVWGSGRRYSLEAHFVSSSGEEFRVNMGYLNYTGWKILSGNIPFRYYKGTDLTSAKSTYAVKLVKLVLWTDLTERVDDFIVYVDNLFVSTTVERLYFDGIELSQEETINKIQWEDSEDSDDGAADEQSQSDAQQ